MRDRYVVVNERNRNEFEKYYQMPYGYSSCYICDSLEEAIEYFKKLNNSNGFIIEKFNSDGRETVYKN